MPSWLLFSIIASVVLTVVLNVGLRLFPGIGQSAERRFLEQAERTAQGQRTGKSGVRVIFPWKTMLIVSLLGTLALNLFL